MHRVPMLRCLAWTLLFVAALTGASGCVNLASNLMYAFGKNKAPGEYDGFKGKKVAIVCGNDRGLSSDATSTLLTRYLEALLSKNVKDITIIKQDKVDKWLDTNGWSESDYQEIGKGVGADQVLAINMSNVTLRDGLTLYKGKADISVSVYDVADDGRVVFRKNYPEFEYPKIGGPTITDTSEARFNVLFLTVVSKRIATLFYDADPNELFAMDAVSASF
ncbi:MAG: hypothetical protein ACTHK7_12300 [Aureliella sp.]